MIHLVLSVAAAFSLLPFSESVTHKDPISNENAPKLSEEPIEIIKDRKRIPLNRCCPHNHLYRTGLGYCRNGTIDSSRPLILPVYSISNILAPPSWLNFYGEDFEMSFDLIKCDDGYIGKNSDQFKIFDDGTMEINHEIFQSNEFCISEKNNLQMTDFIVRFCIPDPCGGINCFRKCCPLGMVVNKTSRMCQPNPEVDSLLTNVTFRDQHGFYSASLDNYIPMDGITPQCHNNGRQAFKPSDFYLLPDGRMKVPSFRCQFERATKEYCIDHFIHDSKRVNDLFL